MHNFTESVFIDTGDAHAYCILPNQMIIKKNLQICVCLTSQEETGGGRDEESGAGSQERADQTGVSQEEAS